MIGRLIDGRYQVRSRIARGGMATVYLATDLRLERRVAIKIMHGHLADDSQFKERFIQEARSAARLAHPNVVNVFDQGQDSDMAYLVMEFLSGITLRDLLTEHRVLTSEQTLDILEAVLSGLAAAHKSGIVHRDLKPENVLLADDGRIKIGDFGLARAVSANTATGAALLGTIAYLSPELVTRGVADARSDIYAVGIMMYEMLAGEQPYRGEQPMQIAYQHANDSVPAPSTKNPNVPAELDELVLWATARDPEERPRDARVMLDQVLETQRQLQTALPTGATAVQRTTVLPTAILKSSTGDQTQIIRSSQPAVTVADISDATGALSRQAGKRRSRAVWWVLLFIVIAGLAGGAGWYFGAGPASMVSIPASIVNQTPDQATLALEELGLTVADTTEDVFSTTVAAGNVASSDPAVGASVSRSTVVTLGVSVGPKPVTIPSLVGATEADARAAATGLNLVVGDNESQFSSDAAAGTVMSVSGIDADGNRIDLPEGSTYFEEMPVVLLISAGAVPDVAGLAVTDAQSELGAVQLTGTELPAVFDATVPSGQVIRVETLADIVRPGDSVNLVVSKGPEMVTVPPLTGLTRTAAVAALEAVGLRARYNSLFDPVPSATVTESDPGEGASVEKGSTVSLFLQLFG
jgi:serine/threonine protein kinase/beta-lactam-binding protein with PASTA domain